MKKMIVACVAVCLLILCSCTGDRADTAVYTFRGGNEELAVQGGVIVVSRRGEDAFVGGRVRFLDPRLFELTDYRVAFYYTGDERVDICANSFAGGLNLNFDLGAVRADDLGFDMEALSQSLGFELTGTDGQGEAFHIQLALDVEQVY